MNLPIIDEIEIDETGKVSGWACALNDALDAGVKLRACAAPRGECVRGFSQAFECREGGAS